MGKGGASAFLGVRRNGVFGADLRGTPGSGMYRTVRRCIESPGQRLLARRSAANGMLYFRLRAGSVSVLVIYSFHQHRSACKGL